VKRNALETTSRFFKYTLLAGASLFIFMYVVLAIFRIRYPFELEWMEGGSVDHVRRILSGQRLYVSPSLDFVPFIYTPLYFYLSAVVSSLLGIGFMPLRLVSFLSSLGCFLSIFLIVKQETRSNFAGILAACLFAATFRMSGAWFDIARIDSLFLLLFLAGLYFVKSHRSPGSAVIAGVCISLSFLTKQAALFICLPIMLYCILWDRRRSVFFVGTVVMIVGISTLLLDHVHDGWYRYYVFDLPRKHVILKERFVAFWTSDLTSPLPVACCMSVFYFLMQLPNSSKKNLFFYLLAAAGMLGGAWLIRSHSGSYSNALFPAYAYMSILFGIGLHAVLEFVQASFGEKKRHMEICLYLCCIMQFVRLIYSPLDQVPTQQDLEAGRKFIKTLASIEGEIVVLYHGYLPTLAGKSTHAHAIAVDDVLRAGGTKTKAGAKLFNEISVPIREKQFSAIVFDSGGSRFKDDIQEHYVRWRPIFDTDSVFWPVTGWRTRPESIYIPRSELIPEPDMKRCKEWGDAIRRIFRNCVGHTSGQGKVIELTWPKPVAFDLVVLQEDIREGERVRAYVVEVRHDHTWRKIAVGTCVGHTRIHRLDTPVTVSQIRLRIAKAIATPKISKLAVYLVPNIADSAEQPPAGGDLKAAPEK